MRIGTKLLLSYMILIGFVGIVAVFALPRWVEFSVIAIERERLEKQVKNLADDFGSRNLLYRLGALQTSAAILEALLVDDHVAITDARCRVLRSTRPELEGNVICDPAESSERPRFARNQLPVLPGVGPALVVSAPIQGDAMRGMRMVLLRDITFIRGLAQPITYRLNIVLGIVLCAALLASGWISREMVNRLKATGVAAQALAEGNLAQRAPTAGYDEITDLANHFNHMAERLQALVEGLRRSERLRKDLLVTVSHELRTPITSIIGFAEALHDGVVKSEEQKLRYYQIIANESARLGRLISDLFDMSRLEAGQMELRMQAIPVADWLFEVIEGFQPVTEGAGTRLEIAISSEARTARIYGDRDRLEQILSNLVSNAVRFSPANEPIVVRASLVGDEVMIAVIDRGPGLPADEAAHVFERFYRGSNKGRQPGGAGLGLAIVKSLIEAHGGTIGVDSTPGAGATFWFRLKQISA